MPDIIQQRALRTWHVNLALELQRDHAVLGLVGEAGEVANQHKKHVFKPGHESTRADRLDELGDALYYLAILAHLDGVTLEDVSKLNAIKLANFHGWQPDNYNRDNGQAREVTP
jgi:NTP pyrophosphatase (non-canonical NTP hydrolase)